MLLAERFWKKVDKRRRRGGCWLWTAYRDRRGYGIFKAATHVNCGAHRMAWTLTNGPIPEGMHVLHRCDNPACINPDHLFLGTHLDNMRDMMSKGRNRWEAPRGENHYSAILTPELVRWARAQAATGRTIWSISRELSVKHRTIQKAIHRRTWKHVVP